MKLTFLGVGGAFAPIVKGNSNMILESPKGKRLLIDFGMTAPYIYRDELKLDFRDIDALWISHLHADHIGGLEMLAFSRYFIPKLDEEGRRIKPKLFMVPELMRELWETSLKGGLQSVEGKVMHLTDYFECIPVPVNKQFVWEEYSFQPVQTIHVMTGYEFKNSFGLLFEPYYPKTIWGRAAREAAMVENRHPRTFITTDTQYAPNQLHAFYREANQIFHDCETMTPRSNVHAHYDDLKGLMEHTKRKMWLYHYGEKRDAAADGFAGFVEKGQSFEV